MPPEADNLYFVVVTFSDGTTKSVVLDERDLNGHTTWAAWLTNFKMGANQRPSWVSLGPLTFHTQGVRSIELIDHAEAS